MHRRETGLPVGMSGKDARSCVFPSPIWTILCLEICHSREAEKMRAEKRGRTQNGMFGSLIGVNRTKRLVRRV